MVQLEDILIRTKIQEDDFKKMIYLNGVIGKQEYQYGDSFKSQVTTGLAEIYSSFDPKKECFWIAELNENIIGCLALKARGTSAQLRYFYILPKYRRIGLGEKLFALSLDFAKICKYKNIYLWTTNELITAQHIYTKYGFKLTEEKESTNYGRPLLERRYDIYLTPEQK